MARFMYGRNGVDQLCWALFIAELVLSLLPALVPGQAFAAFIHYTTLFLCVYLLFRMFSRNLEKRRAENAKFMQWWGPKQSALRGAKARRADKEHKYVKCSCGTYCRLGRKGLRVFREGRRLPFRLPIFSCRSPKRLPLLRKFLKFLKMYEDTISPI